MLCRVSTIVLCIMVAVVCAPFSRALAAESANSPEMLKFYIKELKKYPDDKNLRESIIKMAQDVNPKPRVPDEAERALARGNVYLKRLTHAADEQGSLEALAEFKTVVELAPWLADGYLGMSMAQEKAGLYTEAIQSLKFYQLAAPQAKNLREIKRRLYELEVQAEEARKAKKQAKAAPAPAPAPQPAVPAPVAESPSTAVTTEAPLAKPKQQGFAGDWYRKDRGPRGGDIAVHTFTLSYTDTGALAAVPPKRTADAIGTVSRLEASGKMVKVTLIWELEQVKGYWKTEAYNLVLSDDETTLSGSYLMKDSKGREYSENRTLMRQ